MCVSVRVLGYGSWVIVFQGGGLTGFTGESMDSSWLTW